MPKVTRCHAYPTKRVLKDPEQQPGVHAHAGRDIARPGFVLRCRAETWSYERQALADKVKALPQAWHPVVG